MNGLWLVVAAACIYVLACRFYGRWLARHVVQLDNKRLTPVVRLNDDCSDTRDAFQLGRPLDRECQGGRLPYVMDQTQAINVPSKLAHCPFRKGTPVGPTAPVERAPPLT